MSYLTRLPDHADRILLGENNNGTQYASDLGGDLNARTLLNFEPRSPDRRNLLRRSWRTLSSAGSSKHAVPLHPCSRYELSSYETGDEGEELESFISCPSASDIIASRYPRSRYEPPRYVTDDEDLHSLLSRSSISDLKAPYFPHSKYEPPSYMTDDEELENLLSCASIIDSKAPCNRNSKYEPSRYSTQDEDSDQHSLWSAVPASPLITPPSSAVPTPQCVKRIRRSVLQIELFHFQQIAMQIARSLPPLPPPKFCNRSEQVPAWHLAAKRFICVAKTLDFHIRDFLRKAGLDFLTIQDMADLQREGSSELYEFKSTSNEKQIARILQKARFRVRDLQPAYCDVWIRLCARAEIFKRMVESKQIVSLKLLRESAREVDLAALYWRTELEEQTDEVKSLLHGILLLIGPELEGSIRGHAKRISQKMKRLSGLGHRSRQASRPSGPAQSGCSEKADVHNTNGIAAQARGACSEKPRLRFLARKPVAKPLGAGICNQLRYLSATCCCDTLDDKLRPPVYNERTIDLLDAGKGYRQLAEEVVHRLEKFLEHTRSSPLPSKCLPIVDKQRDPLGYMRQRAEMRVWRYRKAIQDIDENGRTSFGRVM